MHTGPQLWLCCQSDSLDIWLQSCKAPGWMYVTCNMNCIHQNRFRKCLENGVRDCYCYKIWYEEKQIMGYTKKLKPLVQTAYHQNSIMNWVFFQMSLITSNKDTERWKTNPPLLNYTVKILRSSCRCAAIVAATILCKIHPLISFNHRFTTEGDSFPQNKVPWICPVITKMNSDVGYGHYRERNTWKLENVSYI